MMIDLLVHFDPWADASLLFDGRTAVRLTGVPAVAAFDPALPMSGLIEQLAMLHAHISALIGRSPDRLVAYLPMALERSLAERLDAASFAAGFGQFRPVTLVDLIPSLVPAWSGELIVVDASRGGIGGALVGDDGTGGIRVEREGRVVLDQAAVEVAMAVALCRQMKAPPAMLDAVAQELANRWWSLPGAAWSLDARRWDPRSGWLTPVIAGDDANAVDALALMHLKELFDRLTPEGRGMRLVIVGDAAPRMSALATIAAAHLRQVAVPFTSLIDAMVQEGRITASGMDGNPSIQGGNAGETATDIRILLDPRTELNDGALMAMRRNDAVHIPVRIGTRRRLDRVQANYNRTGLAIEVAIDDHVQHIRPFDLNVPLAVSSFSITVSSRWGGGGLLVKVQIPDLGITSLVVARTREAAIVQVGHWGADPPR